MCNHYRNNPEAMAELQTWREYIDWSLGSDPETDIWPKRQGVIARIDNGKHVIDRMTWGVPLTLPGKRPGTSITKNVTNVRNLSSPFWKSMLTQPEQRCLVPFSSFAEPKIGQGRDEHWFAVVDEPVAAFAGIWRRSESGNVYAILTCEPNPLVAPLHPKAMPVVLHSDDYETWLTTDYAGVCALAVPFPSQLMAVS